jgi:hypothetical protein
VFLPVSAGETALCRPVAGSAAATTLLGFALVLLGGSFVVTQALEVGEDPGFGHLALEAAQRRLDALVFADGDLGHKPIKNLCSLTMVASAGPGLQPPAAEAAGAGSSAGAALAALPASGQLSR